VSEISYKKFIKIKVLVAPQFDFKERDPKKVSHTLYDGIYLMCNMQFLHKVTKLKNTIS